MKDCWKKSSMTSDLIDFLSNSQYVSALCGESMVYQIAGEEPRAIISNQEKGSEVLISKATVLNEYLVTVKVS